MDIQELKRLAKNATPGPWHFSRDSWNVSTPECDTDIIVYEPEDPDNTTGEFIAALNPTVAIELISEIEKLRRLKEDYEHIIKCNHKRIAELSSTKETT